MPTYNHPHIIGLTGSFGSGCSYVREILADQTHYAKGYERHSLSSVLKEEFKKETGQDPDKVPRRQLQDFGDRKRREHSPDYFAKIVIDAIQKKPRTKWVVDSIRNPFEVRAFRNFSQGFFLFGIYADKETRWNRVKADYDNDRKAFEADDENDKGEDNVPYGQRVSACFSEADIVFTNDKNFTTEWNAEFKSFVDAKVDTYASLVDQRLTSKQPYPHETLMATAYALSQRSSCLKRKVGAVIVDKSGDIISSGYNEVPRPERPCKDEYNGCHRDWLCDDFFGSLKNSIPEVNGKEQELRKLFRKKFKLLDYCRALHAEENAIINLARNGRSVPLDECALYTTTHPCRLCANKIVNVGIKKIVYLEPYPDPQAQIILAHNGVDPVFFEGITFKAYFRIYGEEK